MEEGLGRMGSNLGSATGNVGDIGFGMGISEISLPIMNNMNMNMNFDEVDNATHGMMNTHENNSANANAPIEVSISASPAKPDDADSRTAAARRRRDVRTARDKLGEQFEELKSVLPRREAGAELTAKSQILEHSLSVLRQLMTRATTLAVELAVVSPEATHRWVQDISDDGRRPIDHTVNAVMKLFCWSRRWQYAEWWTLDETSTVEDADANDMNGNNNNSNVSERNDNANNNNSSNNRNGNGDANGADDHDVDILSSNGNSNSAQLTSRSNSNNNAHEPSPDNVQACVIRDCVSVMKLSRTLINVKSCTRDLSAFARISKDFQFRPRIGMPGRVWSSRRAEWLPTLGDGESYKRSSLALKFGMKTCLAVPVILGGQVHSVMAFYAQVSLPFNSQCHDLATTLSESLANIYSPHPSSGWDISFQRML